MQLDEFWNRLKPKPLYKLDYTDVEKLPEHATAFVEVSITIDYPYYIEKKRLSNALFTLNNRLKSEFSAPKSRLDEGSIRAEIDWFRRMLANTVSAHPYDIIPQVTVKSTSPSLPLLNFEEDVETAPDTIVSDHGEVDQTQFMRPVEA